MSSRSPWWMPGQDADLQSAGESGALCSGDRRLWSLRRHRPGHPAARAPHQAQRLVEVIPVKDLLPWIDKRLRQASSSATASTRPTWTDAEAHAGVLLLPACRQIRRSRRGNSSSATRTGSSCTVWRAPTRRRPSRQYSKYYLTTSGQVYWSDTHQLAGTFDAYRETPWRNRGTEMITEATCPKIRSCRSWPVPQDFLDHKVDMTYGTIRFIEKDDDSSSRGPRNPPICIVCNLHVIHTDDGKAKAAEIFAGSSTA